MNKIDLVDEEKLADLKARAQADGRRIFFISAREKLALEPLVAELWKLRDEIMRHEPLLRAAQTEEEAVEEFPEIEVIYTRE